MLMHFATLFAVITYFWSDWRDLVLSLVRKGGGKSALENRKLAKLIAIANIPAVVGALLFIDMVEGPARSTISVAALMILVAFLFLFIERIAVAKRDLTRFNIYDSVSIGFAQLAAIVPGVSRSGATILAGMYQGLKRDAAARASFLIGAPAILLAGGYSLIQLISSPLPDANWLFIGIAFIAAFGSGYLSIRFMLGYLKSHSLAAFAYYRIAIGVILLAIELLHVKLPWIS